MVEAWTRAQAQAKVSNPLVKETLSFGPSSRQVRLCYAFLQHLVFK